MVLYMTLGCWGGEFRLRIAESELPLKPAVSHTNWFGIKIRKILVALGRSYFEFPLSTCRLCDLQIQNYYQDYNRQTKNTNYTRL